MNGPDLRFMFGSDQWATDEALIACDGIELATWVQR
jgi:hypothetical protein